MLEPSSNAIAELPPDTPPILVVVVDTEEEFDWARPMERSQTAVTAMAEQHRAHRIFERYGIRPTYVIDYAVASQTQGYRPLAELLADGACRIGAHLHPWVNPPHDETVCAGNSYPGNLPPALERAKLAILTDTIAENLGTRPTVYKAGRYGLGPATAATLEALEYEIDASVVPFTDFRGDDGGPDFRRCGARPYWFGRDRRLLEIPLSVCFTGALRRLGPGLRPILTSDWGMPLRLPGIFRRLGLLDRMRLTPEGIDFAEHKALTEAMLRAGHRVFSFTYHSPSLGIGNTPYVQSPRDREIFLGRFERYFDYFFGTLGGRAATPEEIRVLAQEQADTTRR